MPMLKDTITGETRRINICHQCDPDQYPRGKPIDPNDWSAQKSAKGEWVCGDCQIEKLNKRKMQVLGLQHPDVRAFITREDNDCKRWNNYVKRVNQTMRASLKYKMNRYTRRTPF